MTPCAHRPPKPRARSNKARATQAAAELVAAGKRGALTYVAATQLWRSSLGVAGKAASLVGLSAAPWLVPFSAVVAAVTPIVIDRYLARLEETDDEDDL